jgi:hypothetical protein
MLSAFGLGQTDGLDEFSDLLHKLSPSLKIGGLFGCVVIKSFHQEFRLISV